MKRVYMIREVRAIADVSPLSELDPQFPANSFLITRINVPKESRRLGYGTQLLTQILEDADKGNLILYVTPLSSGAMPQRTLLSWYRKHGFRASQTPGYLVRQPGTNGL